MNNFYYIPKEQLKDLNITTDRDTIICLNNPPFRNWIVGFDVFDTSIKDSGEMTLGMDYEALKIPQDVSDSTIIENIELLGETLRDLVLEVLNDDFNKNINSD